MPCFCSCFCRGADSGYLERLGGTRGPGAGRVSSKAPRDNHMQSGELHCKEILGAFRRWKVWASQHDMPSLPAGISDSSLPLITWREVIVKVCSGKSLQCDSLGPFNSWSTYAHDLTIHQSNAGRNAEVASQTSGEESSYYSCHI